MPIDLNLNTKGEEIMDQSRKEMLMSFYENHFHLIPCGSKTDTIPDYFKRRHQYEEDDVLIKRWSKTPRVKWSNYIEKQPTLKEIKQWYLQFPTCNWAAITGINFVVLDADTQEACEFVESGQITRTTMKQKTPRGGYHYFYAINPNLKVRNTTGRLDIRGEGGYVMISPSDHYMFETVDGINIDDMDELPCLSSQDMKVIYDFNDTGKTPSQNNSLLTTDGVDTGIALNSTSNLGTVSTVGIWVKRNDPTDNGKALFGNNANHWQPAMWIGSTTRLYVSLSKWVKPFFHSTGWSNTTDWFYITVTRNGDGASLYKNGAFVDDLTGLGTGETKFDSIGFQSADNSDYYNGNIGPVHFYNRILSTTEILHNYNALKGRFGL